MKIHIVQKGDTLWNIAKKYNVDFNELKSLNNQLSNPDMIYPGMKIKIPSSAVTVPNQGQSYKEQPIKEQPIKEQPMMQQPMKEQPMMQQPTHMKEEITQVVEQPQIHTYPTNIHQDIYQIDLVTVVNEKEQSKPTPIKKPESKPIVPPAKPKPIEIPEVPPVQKPLKQELSCDTMIVQPVQQAVTCQTMQAQIPQEMSCNMMIQPQMPCMPYPFLVPCMPMPTTNCWPMVMMPQTSMPAYGTNAYLPNQTQTASSASDCGCAMQQQATTSTEQMMYGMNQAMPIPAQMNTTNAASQSNAMQNMYGGWQGQYSTPYVNPTMQNQGIPSPYIPMTTRPAEG